MRDLCQDCSDGAMKCKCHPTSFDALKARLVKLRSQLSGVSQQAAHQMDGQNAFHADYGSGSVTVDDRGIGQITTTNGFNDPPKGYVAPTAEELAEVFKKIPISDPFKTPWPITSPNLFPNQSIQQGWECPRCHSINAPFIPKCECK